MITVILILIIVVVVVVTVATIIIMYNNILMTRLAYFILQASPDPYITDKGYLRRRAAGAAEN